MEKTYFWAIYLAPNFAKFADIEKHENEPDEIPYGVLMLESVPIAPKCLFVGEKFSDPSLARAMYQSTMEDFRRAFLPDEK